MCPSLRNVEPAVEWLQQHETMHAGCMRALKQLRALLALPESSASMGQPSAKTELEQLVVEVLSATRWCVRS
jgi:hypothetical protein